MSEQFYWQVREAIDELTKAAKAAEFDGDIDKCVELMELADKLDKSLVMTKLV